MAPNGKAAKYRYPRLAGSPCVHITLGSFKIQAGFRDPFRDSGNAGRSAPLPIGGLVGGGNEEALGTGISS